MPKPEKTQGKVPNEVIQAAAVSAETPQSNGSPTRQEIELRAYEIYERRGRTDGNDVEDWLQAETELLEEAAQALGLARGATA